MKFTNDDSQLLRDIMASRRDVRGHDFSDEAIQEKEITAILESAQLAPSVGLSQPWEFVIVEKNEIKREMKSEFERARLRERDLLSDQKKVQYDGLKLDGILESPINVAVFYHFQPQHILGKSQMKETGPYSVVCAIQNMWLMARSLNIGMGWVSILDPTIVKKVLKIPQEWTFVAYLCLGKLETFRDRPELEEKGWDKRRSLKEFVHQNYPGISYY